MRQHQRGPLQLLDDIGHREGFAAAGHAHEHLLGLAALQTFNKFLDGGGLIPRGLKR